MEPTVVVGYDQSPDSELALEEAAAAAEQRAAALTVVHAYRSPLVAPPPFEMPIPGYSKHDAASRVTEPAADRMRADHPGLTITTTVVHGPPAHKLAEAAAEADLLVVGHRGHGGFPGLGLGSVALRAVTHSTVPTLVVRGGRRHPRGTVLAAVDVMDPDGGSEEVLEFAFAEAARRAAKLKAVSAWEILWPPAYFGDRGELRRAVDLARERADAALARLLKPWRDKYPDVEAEHELVEGDPATVLLAACAHADLVVAGARRRGERGARLGPVDHTLLRHADCPVAVVPHG
ncbi:MAG: universal stress protein [Catenulispora sp.]|nr:universal stress protein [Catenulispora sp.]